MALSIRETASYAAGDSTHHSLGEGSKRLTGKHRRTVYSQASRPLFVAEAEFKASKVFTRSKKGLLALYGTDLHVVDVLGLEAAESNGLADVTQHVLRWVNYINLLDVSFTGPATLKIEHGDTSDKAKIRGVGESLAAASEDDMYNPGLSMGGASAASTSAAGAPPSSGATLRVTSESFSLTFRDAGIAQRAAAALLFQQAQYAAVRHWLRTGLHAGFRCDLVSVQALPLMFHDQGIPSTMGPGGLGALTRSHSVLPAHVLYSCASGSYSGSGAGAAGGAGHASGAGGHASGAGFAGFHAAAGAAAAVPYPWGDADAQQWGCSVPLPAGWGPLLEAAAKEGSHGGRHGHEHDEPGVTPEELTVPVVLEHGPKAVQVTISTPLGAAVATITPQLAKAALMYSTCREILALPLHPCGSSSSAAPMAAFTWSVHSSVSTAPGAAAAAEGSTGSSGSTSTAGAPPEGGGDADIGGSVSSAGAHSTGGLPLMHTTDAFAVLMVQIVRSPGTANTRGAGRVFDPTAVQAPAAPAAALAGSWAGAPGQQYVQAVGAGESSSGDSSSSSWQSNSSVQVQLAACALLAALALQQFSGQLWLLLLLAVLAATAIKASGSISSSSSGSTSIGSSRATSGSNTGRPPSAAWLQGSSGGSSTSTSTEDPKCCGWSLMLIGADLCSAPGRHLQLQVSLAKATKGMARLRLRMASMSAGGAPVALLGTPSDEEEDDVSVPVLVSDPEPAWLTPDTKQRFINAKPTLEASKEQARRTHKWRQQMNIDSVLGRPCPKFPLMCSLLPTYLLSDDSPEGHAVFLMKVGGVKDLCDAIFQTPEGSPEGLSMLEVEHTLALLNEYLVRVAAPNALPAGFQVQIYDLAGFKLSYVMGDMFTLFKVLVRFGLYYPERLRLALVINAPAWFSTPWKAMSAFLDENTSAKVVVVGKPQSALSTLSHHLGGMDNVPVAWGGKCSLPFEEYPANVRMMQFGQRLNAGEQPLAGLQRSS